MRAPSSIQLHKKSRVLEVGYADGTRYALPCEYLRVFSPSADVRGHTGGEFNLVPGKRNVAIDSVDPVGSYAVRLVFDDGHSTGLYSWDVLEDLGANHDAYWKRYLARLEEHGMSRDSDLTKLSALPAGPKKWKPAN
ncbi:MAG: gamma-butyrobetaine hydroxylase-like domain-containing protein [Gammaproteobacteria bacterium]